MLFNKIAGSSEKVTINGNPPTNRIKLQLNFKYGRTISTSYKQNNSNHGLDSSIYGYGYLKKSNEYFIITSGSSGGNSRFCTLNTNQMDTNTPWIYHSFIELNYDFVIDTIVKNDEIYMLTEQNSIYKLNNDYKTSTLINKIPTQFSCSYLQTSFNYIEKEDSAYIFKSISSDKTPLKYDFKKNVFTTTKDNDSFGDKRRTTVKGDKIYTLQGNSLICFSEGLYTTIPINLSFQYMTAISAFKDKLIIFGGTEYKKTYNLYLGNDNNTNFELISVLPIYCDENNGSFLISTGRTILILNGKNTTNNSRGFYEISSSYEEII